MPEAPEKVASRRCQNEVVVACDQPATAQAREKPDPAGPILIGHFAPHEGSAAVAHGLYHVVESLAACEQYRARLAAYPQGRANHEFAKDRQFIRREERIFFVASAPHGKVIRP